MMAREETISLIIEKKSHYLLPSFLQLFLIQIGNFFLSSVFLLVLGLLGGSGGAVGTRARRRVFLQLSTVSLKI